MIFFWSPYYCGILYRGPQGLTIYLVRRTFRFLQEKFEHIWFRQESGRVIAIKRPMARSRGTRKSANYPPSPPDRRWEGAGIKMALPEPMSSVKTWMFQTEKKCLISRGFDQNLCWYLSECFNFHSEVPEIQSTLYSVSFILFHIKTCRFFKLQALGYW